MPTKSLPVSPRIAVVGAGVLGTVYGARLAIAGHAVTMIERNPARVEQIRTNGLQIAAGDKGAIESVPVAVFESFPSTESFDLAIVIARKTHLAAILEMLGGTTVPHVLIMASNAEGPDEIVRVLGERAVLGFPGAGGRLVDGVVRYNIPPGAMQPSVLGEVGGQVTPRIRTIKSLFDSAGFHAKIVADIDAWLKSHEAFVATIGNATYVAGSGRELAADRELLTLNILAIRELYAAMEKSDIPVAPTWFRLWRQLPVPVIRATFGRFVGSKAWDDLGTDQLMSMRDEVEVISEELVAFAAERGESPSLAELIRRREALSL